MYTAVLINLQSRGTFYTCILEHCILPAAIPAYSVLSPLRLKGQAATKPTGMYGEQLKGFKVFDHAGEFVLKYGGVLPELRLAYETWGELNPEGTNAVLLFTGLSASSHAHSHEVRKVLGRDEASVDCGFGHESMKYIT